MQTLELAQTLWWSLNEAVDICRKVEEGCPAAGCHVALTGGTLYKDGFRKDLDFLFYRIRQADNIDANLLFNFLEGLGFTDIRGFGWVFAASQQ